MYLHSQSLGAPFIQNNFLFSVSAANELLNRMLPLTIALVFWENFIFAWDPAAGEDHLNFLSLNSSEKPRRLLAPVTSNSRKRSQSNSTIGE